VEALERVIAAAWHELDSNRAIAQTIAEQLNSEAVTRAHEPRTAPSASSLSAAGRGRSAGTSRRT
jgi:hypothetical protein